jgi:hypothetical protein
MIFEGINMDGWHIHYNPKPIPDRRHDWDYWHDDCDDGNGLHGTAASRQDAEMAIVEAEEDRVETKKPPCGG